MNKNKTAYEGGLVIKLFEYEVWLAADDTDTPRVIAVQAPSDRAAYKAGEAQCKPHEHVRLVVERP